MSDKSKVPKLSFRDAALRSGLVSGRQLRKVVELTASQDDEVIAATLVKSGVITEYQSHQLKSGRTKLTLGPYLITDWLGQGGMGQVFKAVHKVMGRECAVKVLPLEKMTDITNEAFRREIRMQAGLDCPYLVRAYDAGQDGSVQYLVTEYVPGTDLRRLIRNGGALNMGHAAMIISQAARGLQYAHELGIVHRDIKPGNILVTPDGQAKVSDIGLAGYMTSPDDDPRAGKIVGTADYLSPEQIRNPRSVGSASDIYSLGCTLYYTVTGKVPFPGGDSKSKCKRHCEQTPWHPRKFAPELSEDFVDTIADMMEKDPARRIATAEEVAERLEAWCVTAYEAIDRPIGRQAWTAPPPPDENPGVEPPLPLTDYRNDDSDMQEGNVPSASSIHLSAHSDSLNPSLMNDTERKFPRSRRRNHTLPILIALAIAVPISLLVGAIIGFLVRGTV